MGKISKLTSRRHNGKITELWKYWVKFKIPCSLSCTNKWSSVSGDPKGL